MNSKNIVALTGAGISAESGIDTFRAKGGLWEQYPVQQVATPEGFAADPALVHHFYNLRRAALKTVEPNPAHKALARLEAHLSENEGSLLIVTQNVDDLHERGGAKTVLHMHGILTSMLCGACGWRWDFEGESSVETVCPACKTRSAPRPDIVWFGEMPYEMDRIEAALRDCDLFVSIGTSGAVYPAAGFVQMAKTMGTRTLEINLEPSAGSHWFDENRYGRAGELVPVWISELIEISNS